MTRRSVAACAPQPRAAMALAAVAALAGCSLGPDFERPRTEVPANWSNARPTTMPAWPAPDWWTAFNSPQLNALMAKARDNNTDVAAAAARIRQADAQSRIAGAPLLPSLEAQTNVGPTRLLNNSGRERHYTIVQGVLQASYEIDFWGKNRAALQSAEAAARATRYDREVVWLTTTASVATAYFQLLALQDRLLIARENQAAAQNNLGGVVLQQKGGTVPELNVVQQQAVVANLATVRPLLEQQVALTKNALAVLVGEMPGSLRLQPETFRSLSLPTVAAGLPSELLARRPDVQEAEAQLEAANADIRMARAEFFPSFALTAKGGLTSLLLSHAVAGPLGTYSLLSSITQPLFKGGALRGQLDKTKARYQELLAGNYRKAVLSAFSDVEDALAGVKATADEVAALERSLAVAQRADRMATLAYRGGIGTILAVLLSETSVYSARDALAQARLAHMQAVVGLNKALGGGWTP